MPSRRGGNLAAKAKAKQETNDDDRDALGSLSAPRRSSYTSESAAEGSVPKRPKIDSSEGFLGPSSSHGRPAELQPPPSTSSNVATWTTSQLDMWSSVLSGVNRSPLPNTGILPHMQTSPSLSFGVNLAAPSFSSAMPPAASSSAALPSFVNGSDRPTLPPPHQPAALTQGSGSMPPPAERTSPSFHAQRADQSNHSQESTSSHSFAKQPSTSSAFPPPASSGVLFPAPPSHPPPLRPPPPRRMATAHTASRPENFITAGMANEADALSLLALTATGEKQGKGSGRSPGTASEPADTPDGRQSERSLRSEGSSHRKPGSAHAGDGTGTFEAQVRELDEREQEAEVEEEERVPTLPPLAECDLIRKGALTKRLLVKYVSQFFSRHHQIFVRPFHPRVSFVSPSLTPTLPTPWPAAYGPGLAHAHDRARATDVCAGREAPADRDGHYRKPARRREPTRTREGLGDHVCASDPPPSQSRPLRPLLTRQCCMRVKQGYIHNCVVKGRETTVGFVESMLLLSENLPRQEEKDAIVLATDTKTWDDSTQSWFFVGHAVRTGYLLGLDQVREPVRALLLCLPSADAAVPLTLAANALHRPVSPDNARD